MQERRNAVTFKDQPMTLVGPELKVGDKAPDVALTANDMSLVKLSSFAGTVRVLSAVPSLDTPVCDIETRRFNQSAGQFNGKGKIITVSLDLPFAQKRWCAAAGIKDVVTLSDYRDAAFGQAYGVLVKELHLLARCIFIVGADDRIEYIQLVNEITHEPNYDEVIEAANRLATVSSKR
jgi:thiol peroxidase